MNKESFISDRFEKIVFWVSCDVSVDEENKGPRWGVLACKWCGKNIIPII